MSRFVVEYMYTSLTLKPFFDRKALGHFFLNLITGTSRLIAALFLDFAVSIRIHENACHHEHGESLSV